MLRGVACGKVAAPRVSAESRPTASLKSSRAPGLEDGSLRKHHFVDDVAEDRASTTTGTALALASP
jgi:hypothetical protein